LNTTNCIQNLSIDDIIQQFDKQLMFDRIPNASEKQSYQYEKLLDKILSDFPYIQLDNVGIVEKDTGLNVELKNDKLTITGLPKIHGIINIFVEYKFEYTKINQVISHKATQSMMILPDPKTLWKNLPTDSKAPYQSPNEKSLSCFDIYGKTLIAASKRGRSHAHEGKFRDDDFDVKWLPETGWLIVAVSDGAGSAEFSRKGAQIACSTFVNELTEKLSSQETNTKIEAIEDPNIQEQALGHLLLTVSHKAALNIQDFSEKVEQPIKKFSATFLGYVAKKINEQWLICAVGIGDGAIAIVGDDDRLYLMNKPDGGEYVGQTRFLTTPEVWKNPQHRVISARVDRIRYIFSMTDGVSDPKFETDNNLLDIRKWLVFIDDVFIKGEHPVNFLSRSSSLESDLLAWLDFWSKGNHDDRTLTILF
jgi:hypothetical protein